MISKINQLLKTYKEVISYGVFGVLTTLVNLVTYFIFTTVIDLSSLGRYSYLFATIIAWIVSVLFAFYTNKYYVFQSKTNNIIKEMINFFGFRVVSLIIDVAVMFLMVDVLIINDLIAKVSANVIVIILNYFFSKWFVFKKK